jgi:hypothetical protein
MKKKKVGAGRYERLPESVSGLNGVGIPGLSAKLIMRTDKKALYKRSDDVWEVFLIKIDEACHVFGKSYPRREVYPGNEDFGKTAYCYNDEKSAKYKYDKI